MTWIRCSDRMPMGEACEVRIVLAGTETITRFSCANVATLRAEWGCFDDWIDRTEWRPLEPAPIHDEGEPATWHDETGGVDEEVDLESHVYTVKPGCDEAVRDLLRSDKPIPERLRELMQWRGLDDDEEVFRAALVRFGFEPQLSMLTEECGELVAAVNRYRRGRDGAFEAMIEEMADVSILIKQMKLVYGDEIEQAEARKLARLKERLE